MIPALAIRLIPLLFSHGFLQKVRSGSRPTGLLFLSARRHASVAWALKRVVESVALVESREELCEITHLLCGMLVQAARELVVHIGLSELACMLFGYRDLGIAAREDAEPKSATHFAAVIGVANKVGHASEIDGMIEIAYSCAN